MNTVLMKEKLHRFIENVEEKRMKTIYALFEQEIDAEEWEYTDEFKAELDHRYDQYTNGSGVVITAEEANKQTQDLMRKIKAK